MDNLYVQTSYSSFLFHVRRLIQIRFQLDSWFEF